MKGKLHKTDRGWVVSYEDVVSLYPFRQTYSKELHLHPDDVKQIEKDAQVFDNIEARIACYPDVDFHEIIECPNYNGKHFGKRLFGYAHHRGPDNHMAGRRYRKKFRKPLDDS